MSKYISKDELNKKAYIMLEYRVKNSRWYPDVRVFTPSDLALKYTLNNIKDWPEALQNEFKKCKACVYSGVRNVAINIKQKKNAKLFIETFNTGALDEFLRQYGFRIYKGKVRAIDCGYPLIAWVLDNYVIPKLATEMHIVGVKRTRRPTANSTNVLDWSNARIASTE